MPLVAERSQDAADTKTTNGLRRVHDAVAQIDFVRCFCKFFVTACWTARDRKGHAGTALTRPSAGPKLSLPPPALRRCCSPPRLSNTALC